MKEDARNMNDLPERAELYTLEEGEEKVTMTPDSRLPNTAIFHFHREDHTLGNLLSSALLSTDHVTFAAYKVPHPLFPHFHLRVSTSPATTPREALHTACSRIITELRAMAGQFTREWEIWKLTNEAAAGRGDAEREMKMEVARKERDRVRLEMMREGAQRPWGGTAPTTTTTTMGDDGGDGYHPNSTGPAPWEGSVSPPYQPPASSARAPWEGGASPPYRPPASRAAWEATSPDFQPTAAASSVPWGAGGTSPAYRAPNTSRADGGTSPAYQPPATATRAQWQSGAMSPTYRPTTTTTTWQAASPPYHPPAAASTRAPWEDGGMSPAYQPSAAAKKAPWEATSPDFQPAAAASSMPWGDGGTSPVYRPNRNPREGGETPAYTATRGGPGGRVPQESMSTYSRAPAPAQNDPGSASPPRNLDIDGELAYRQRFALTFAPAPAPAATSRDANPYGIRAGETTATSSRNTNPYGIRAGERNASVPAADIAVDIARRRGRAQVARELGEGAGLPWDVDDGGGATTGGRSLGQVEEQQEEGEDEGGGTSPAWSGGGSGRGRGRLEGTPEMEERMPWE